MTAGTLAPYPTISVVRSASAGAFATLIFFTLGWAWAAVGLPGSDVFLGMFTHQLPTRPAASGITLVIGGFCAFLVGGIYGALIAHCYNLAGRLFGR
jgi:hypothetical protein